MLYPCPHQGSFRGYLLLLEYPSDNTRYILNAYYDKGKSDGRTEGYNSGYQDGYNARNTGFNITVKTDTIHRNVGGLSGANLDRTIYTTPASGRLRLSVASGYYDNAGEHNVWHGISIATVYIYNASGGLKTAYASHACDGISSFTPYIYKEFDLSKGDYVVVKCTNPGTASGGYGCEGTFSYAIVN